MIALIIDIKYQDDEKNDEVRLKCCWDSQLFR